MAGSFLKKKVPYILALILLISTLVAVSVVLSRSSEDTLEGCGIKEEDYHTPVPPHTLLNHLSTKRPYGGDNTEEQKNKGNFLTSNFQVVEPEGCQALKLWYFGRHGTRNPGKSDTLKMIQDLPNLRERILNASQSCLGYLGDSEIQSLKGWQLPPQVTPETDSYLVRQGEWELKGIGRRFKKRFPHLFSETPETSIRFRSTPKQRAIASASSFAQGAFDPGQIPQVIFEEPNKIDFTVRFYESCTKWLEEVEENPAANLEMTKFEKSLIMNRTVARVSERLGLGNASLTFDEVELIYTTCSFETAWENGKPSPWCGVFDEEDLQAMAYREDLEEYWMNGYGYTVNYEQACKPFEDLLEFLSLENPLKVRGYFSHSGAMLKMLARLGLFKDQTPLRSDDYDQVKNTYKWRSSFIDTMATNMAFVLYNCTGNDSTSLQVGFLFQEKPLALPACGNKWMCPLQTFLEGYSSSIGQCNFNATCGIL